jgi:hypothetical protein
VTGEHAKDILHLAGIDIPDQVFAQVTSLSNFKTCAGEEGLLGLGFSEISSHNFPTVLQNIKDRLRFPIFSLYLDRRDDYPPADFAGNDHEDSSGNQNFGEQKPLSASSELIFGGVNHAHYENCISWHDLGQFQLQDGEEFKGYWDFKLDEVRIGGTSLPSSVLAIVDSGSSFLIGPTDAVGRLAEMDSVDCLSLEDPDQPELVPCNSQQGFDAAVLDCNQPVFNLDFVADGVTYSLSKDDLITEIDTDEGPICVLRILTTPGIDAWILGDVFLNLHYSVFDFGNRKVGFARLSESSGEVCQADWPMDINNKDGNSGSNSDGSSTEGFGVGGKSSSAFGGRDESAAPAEPTTGVRPPELPTSSAAAVSTTASSPTSTSSFGDSFPIFGKTGIVLAALIVLSLVAFMMLKRRRRYKRAARFDDMVESVDVGEELEMSGGVLS